MSFLNHFGAGSLCQLNLKGSFSWELLFDIDNTENSGSIRRQIEYKTSISSSYSEMKKSVESYMTGATMGANVGGTLFEVVNIGVKSDVCSEIRSTYENLSEKRVESRHERTKTDEYIVGPNSKLKLYHLVFNGPGVHYQTETVSSTPHAVEDVLIDVTVRQIHILESVDIVYTEDSVSRPDDTIQMVKGDNPDINKDFKGMYVWLVPKWTKPIDAGITGIQIVIQGEENGNYSDMAKGAGGDYRYIRYSKDPRSNQRITDLGLYRTEDGNDDPLQNGWQQKSIDINRGRGGDFLYLVWNTRSVDLFM